MIIILAIVYVCLFLVVGARQPKIAMMLTFAAAPFQNDLASEDLKVHFSLAEINLVLCGLIYLKELIGQGRRFQLGPLALPIFFYFAVCLISSLRDWHDTTTISLMQTALFVVGAVVIFAALGERDAEDFMYPMWGLIVVCLFLALVLVGSASNYFLGLNKNGLGGSLSCGTLVATELWLSSTTSRRRILTLCATIICAAGLVMTVSRGSWLGTMSGLIVMLCIKAKFKAMARTAAVMIPLAAIVWFSLPPDVQEFATSFDVRRENIHARLETIQFAESKFESEPMLGVGVGLRKEIDATNIIMTSLAETGILGLATFVWIHVAIFWMLWKARMRVFVGSASHSVIAICAGLVTAKLTHGLVDHYWSRGSLMLAWCGVGMALRVYFNAMGPAAPVFAPAAPLPDLIEGRLGPRLARGRTRLEPLPRGERTRFISRFRDHDRAP